MRRYWFYVKNYLKFSSNLYFIWFWHLSKLISVYRQQFHTTAYIFPLVIMSSFLPEKEHMQEALLFCFNSKKSAPELHRMLVEAYDDSALSETTRRDWFRRFKDGNFDLSDKRRENRFRKVEDHQLQALLDKDDTQSPKCLQRNWVLLKQPFPYVYVPWERFAPRQSTIAHVKNGLKLLGDTQLGGAP